MDRAFGVEIELLRITREHAQRVLHRLGIDIRDESYNHATRTWWKVVSDSSISDGFEVVSPILRGEDGLEALKTVVTALDDAGGRVDRRCGMHIHLDGRDLQLDDLRGIVNRYAQYEDQIDAFMPPSRRGGENRFCRSLVPVAQNERFLQARTVSQLIAAQPDRYYKLNLKPYLTQGSIEFRQHSGTLNSNKIHNWLCFLDGFVKESCRLVRSPAQNPPHGTDLPRLQPKLANLARMLIESPGGLSSAALQQQLGIQAHSLRANMTYLRRNGLEVEGFRAQGETHYRLLAAGREQAVDNGLFSGVAPEVARFYHDRALALSARNR